MKNVLPPVIENLLTEAKEAQTEANSDALATAIQAVEQYKKQLEQNAGGRK